MNPLRRPHLLYLFRESATILNVFRFHLLSLHHPLNQCDHRRYHNRFDCIPKNNVDVETMSIRSGPSHVISPPSAQLGEEYTIFGRSAWASNLGLLDEDERMKMAEDERWGHRENVNPMTTGMTRTFWGCLCHLWGCMLVSHRVKSTATTTPTLVSTSASTSIHPPTPFLSNNKKKGH
ncbi:hypothetical protein BDN72DRAFT_92652 [Pluteus cervinus]|uniref:Uncharacterized protein n=1 Tax=Pluteus cervinus TaxID=181527 RepID=A0ACD3AQE6_9AGAR|nr:hypothetical protein BDN72DRAFT_92652 [Pluteus cervinus]